MKTSSFVKIALLAMPLTLSSCFFHKKQVVKEPQPVAADTVAQRSFLGKVSDNAVNAKFITSKVKFSVAVDPQTITLTGNLKMKRDDVIRLQLMAFGFVEAGRIEFTKDYVLIMDRINKLYLKTPYSQVDFLRNSGINFYTLQALFWNELFVPGRNEVRAEDLEKFSADLGGEEVIISLDQDNPNSKMNYSWLADHETGRIKMANILYKEKKVNYEDNKVEWQTNQLNWDYKSFAALEKGNRFPDDMEVTLVTPKKEVKMGVTLKYIGHDTEWETRTEVSNKYREVSMDEMLRRVMAL